MMCRQRGFRTLVSVSRRRFRSRKFLTGFREQFVFDFLASASLPFGKVLKLLEDLLGYVGLPQRMMRHRQKRQIANFGGGAW